MNPLRALGELLGLVRKAAAADEAGEKAATEARHAARTAGEMAAAAEARATRTRCSNCQGTGTSRADECSMRCPRCDGAGYEPRRSIIIGGSVLIVFLALAMPARAQVQVPPECPDILAAQDPDTVAGLRGVLLCERLTSAAGLRAASDALAKAGDPPSRLGWLTAGIVAATSLCVAVSIADWRPR